MDYDELKKKYTGGRADAEQGSSGSRASRLALAVVAIAIAAPILYLFYQLVYSATPASACFAGTMTFGDCVLSDKPYRVCCFDDDGNILPCNEKALQCGSNVMIKVDVNKLDVPGNFYMCEKYDRLDESSENNCMNTLTSFDEATNKMYACTDKAVNVTEGGHVFAFNYGRLPDTPGEVSLMEVYVADGSMPMKDVLKQVESFDRLLDVRGNVIC